MKTRLTAIVEREGDGYVALCPEVDVASQGSTVAEARDNLAEALSLFFETAGAGEAKRRLRRETYVMEIEVPEHVAPDHSIGQEQGRTIEEHLDELERIGALVPAAAPKQGFQAVERRPGALARFLHERRK